MNKLGIPFTKGYEREFDRGYETKSKEWLAAQSAHRNDYRIETDIEREQGLAVRTRKREQEICQTFTEEKYPFEKPGIILDPYGMTPLCAYVCSIQKKSAGSGSM